MAKSRTTTYLVDTTEVVDMETGEIGKIERTKRQKINVESEPFYMVFIDHVAPFYNLTNGTAKNVLAWMCNRATFNTGQISLSSKDREKLMEDLNIKKSALSNILKELKKKNLISGDKGTYTINPQIFWKGDLLTRKALLDVKEIQVAFSINLDSANLKETKEDASTE